MATSGFFSSLGLGNINVSSIVTSIFHFIGIFLLVLILGGIIAAFYFARKRNKNKGEVYKVGWWREVGDSMQPGKLEEFEEVMVPGTNLRLFYNKKNDHWVPRFTRGITPTLFYVELTPTNQMINFQIPSISHDKKNAKLLYDHTDMLWAAENAREYVKRNYKDKAVKWWQLYQNTIATAALILVITFSFVIIIFFFKGIIDKLGGLVSQIGTYTKQLCTSAQPSGLIGG